MNWYYLHSNSKLLETLEQNRNSFYLFLFLPLGVLAIIISVLFSTTSGYYLAEIEILASLVVLNFVRLFFKNQQSWLSAQIYSSISSVNQPKFQLKPFDLLKLETGLGLCFYSLLSLLAISVGFFSENIWLISTLKQPFVSRVDSSFLKTLWQVDAAVVSVTFISITFILELLRSRETITARVFSFVIKKLRYKHIVFWNFLALIPLGLFALVDINGSRISQYVAGISIFLFVFTVLSTIHLFSRLIQLVQPGEAIKATIQATREIIRKVIIDEIFHRVAANQLYKIGGEKGFLGFGFDSREDLHPVRKQAPARKLISDIKIDSIIELMPKLQKAINNKGQKLVITKQIGSIIELDDNIIARVHSKDYSEALKKNISSYFRTKDLQTETDEIKDLLEVVRDQAVSSVNKAAKSNFNASLDIFYESLNIILEIFDKIDAKFDFKAAREPFVETRSIHLIQRSLREITNEAFLNRNKDILIETLYFPKRLMVLALSYKDHLIFKFGIHLYSYAYYSYRQNYQTSDPLLIDRIWRHIKEFCDFELGRKINNFVESEEDYNLLRGYITEVMLVFTQLLKVAVDNSDDFAFGEFLKGFDRVFRHFTRSFRDRNYDLDLLQFQLERARDDSEKRALSERIEIAERATQLKNDINEHRKNIKFGIGAWMLRQLVNNQIENSFAIKNLEHFYTVFGGINEISQLYFAIDKRQVREVYGWSWWETEKFDEGVAHAVDDTWLLEFYGILALKALNPQTDSQLALMPASEDKEYFSSSGLNLVKEKLSQALDRIRSQKGKYHGILSDVDLDKSGVLIEMHEKGVVNRKEEEDRHIREAELDQSAVRKFRQKFLKTWEATTTLRKLFLSKNSFEDKTDQVIRGRRPSELGFETPETKQLFIKDVNVGFTGFGEHYGSWMGRNEDLFLAKEILKNIQQTREVDQSGFIKEFDSVLKSFRQSGYQCHAILLGGLRDFKSLHKSGKFVPRWRLAQEQGLHGIVGTYDRIPIFDVPGPAEENYITLIDIKKIGRIVQFRAAKETEGNFYFSIKPLTVEMFDKMVVQNPDILKDKETGNVRDREEVLNEYLKRVHLKVFQRIVFKSADKNAGVVIKISD